MNKKLSIIIPARNEAQNITKTLTALLPFRHAGHEIIVVDGESTDDTAQRAYPFCDRVIHSPAGRAVQMNAGAKIATGELLLFLHADTRLPRNAVKRFNALCQKDKPLWGRFNVQLSGDRAVFKLIATAMNLRSRITGIATGDQAIFVHKTLFERIGGYAEIPLMEDIALSKSLKRQQRPLCLKDKVLTSSRRWEEHGVWRTVRLMWGLRLAYYLGVSPDKLSRYYR